MASGKKLTNEEALSKINEECSKKNVEFIGFKNDENVYTNAKVHLILKCNKCGNVWDTTTFNTFVHNKRSCSNCNPTKPKTEEEITNDIVRLCKEKDFTFLGFNGDFIGVMSKLNLMCNKCGYTWNTTTYVNLSRKGRKCHSCGRKNPSSMPTNLDANHAIEKLNTSLKNTSLEFLSFDENGYNGRKNAYVLLKCKKCGEVSKFGYSYILKRNGKVFCKFCESNGKFSNETAIEKVIEKCKLLDYTFLGFDTTDGKYKGKETKLKLKCNKCSYMWTSTSFDHFTRGIITCLGCNNYWKMEKEVECVLKENNIDYIHDCRRDRLPWLVNKISLSLDFYIPKLKIGIECQGRQHFEAVMDFGGEEKLKKSIERDKKKLKLCKEHDVKLLYYDSEGNHTEFLGEKVYNNENKLLKEILQYVEKN